MDHHAIFQGLYEAFNRRDADSVLAMMSEGVDWPNAWKGGGRMDVEEPEP